jgi:hypothetical protein
MSDRPTEFDYLLNAMERAAQAKNPAKAGYAAKRKAVLEHVAKMTRASIEGAKDAERLDWLSCHASDEIHLKEDGGGALVLQQWVRRYITSYWFRARTLREAIDLARTPSVEHETP